MSRISRDHVHRPDDQSCVALLLIDVINDLEFPEGEQLLRSALPMAKRIAELKRRAVAADVPVIYCNDNFGQWRSDFQAQVDHCLHDGVRGEPITKQLQPQSSDYFILKPKHSGFHCTPLSLLLESLQAETLVLTGLAGNICVLFTAHDAYMRNFRIYVPADCVASNTPEENEAALQQMQKIVKADIRNSTEIDFDKLLLGSEPSR
ncbi:cysteine hydrolase family protein [Planctomicrobium sp. SH664]|uniref:cysteine hydrolase family protein n=1 Tax=Planctomicrobium sp. SH664 TaxID=3448125 RepID=UPI003F5B7825